MMESAAPVPAPYFGQTFQSATMLGKPDVSAITSATAALEEARALASRVDDIVNRLCGMVPQAVSGNDPRAPASSIFNGLRGDAERTTETLRNAHSQLNRLERELP